MLMWEQPPSAVPGSKIRLSGLKNRAALDGQPRAAVPHKSQFFYRNLLICIDAHFAGNLHCLFSDLTRRQLCMLGESLRCGLRIRAAAADSCIPAVRLDHAALATQQKSLFFI